MTLSVVMITHNSLDVVEGALQSIKGVGDELLIGDGGSTDGTEEIVKIYGATVVSQREGTALGVRKQELVERAKGDWILVLDADERVGSDLREEIRRVREGKSGRECKAYRIPYQNYVFGRAVHYGGERYAKVRLFRRGFGSIAPDPLHEEVIVVPKLHKARPSQRLRPGLEDGLTGELKGVIHHHSYRTPRQLFTKFTRYAWMAAARQTCQPRLTATGVILKKLKPGFQNAKPGFERLSFKKLFLYGPHMFWARFVKEKGYKDGWRGFVLALAFGYMEGLTYWLIFIRQIISRPGLPKS